MLYDSPKKKKYEGLVNISRYFFFNLMKLVEVYFKVCQSQELFMNMAEKSKQI